MVSIVLLINGQKKLIPLTSDVGSGVPLGTLVAFSDDQPKDGYVQMGTTFDETKYPMLFAMRGSNVLPAMFDHSRLGDVETILDSNSQGSYTINSVDYDGVMFISANQGSAKKFEVYINDERVTRAYDSTSVSWMQTATIEVKKGDKVFIDVDANYPMKITARYYKHPLFIKATSGLSENQQENVLNTLNNNLSYSTEEHATGRRWIDGKMIYNIAVEDTSNTSASPTAISSSAYDILSTKNIERVISACWSRPPANGYNAYYVPVEIEITSSSIKKKGMSSASGYAGSYLILDYIKTT